MIDTYTTAWATGAEPSNYLGRYTHANLPNSLAHDVLMYPQFPVPLNLVGKHSNVEILTQSYGIVTVRPVENGGKTIIKVYRTSGVVDQTTYGSCGDVVTFQV